MIVELVFFILCAYFIWKYIVTYFEGNAELDFNANAVFARVRSFNEISVNEVQEFWDSRPCNLNHSNASIGTKKYFDEVEKKKYFVEPHIPAFAEFSAWKGKKVLEIGCGIGTESVNFARNGAEITAIDISSRSIQLTKERFKLYDLQGQFFVSNAEELDKELGGKKFDLIWSFGVIHHTPHPKLVFQNMKNLLSLNGEIRIMLYSKISHKLFFLMKETGIWDYSKMEHLIAQYAEAQSGCPIAYTYTFDELRELLEGFEILEMRKTHIFPYKIPEYKKHIFVKEDYFKNVSADLFKKLESELGWHTLVRARLAVPS
jgi:2-polyprenyl-3-methyl-5-hydroxy-6-metoxy-1,4-benzoquinol methylase